MGSERVVNQMSKRVYLEVTILRILAMLAPVIGIYLELKGTGALIEALVITSGLFIISESRLTDELIRSEIKSACDKMDRKFHKEIRRNN